MSDLWQISFALGPLDSEVAGQACFDCGAASVTFVDAADDPVLEPLPGELRLWPSTIVRALFADEGRPAKPIEALSAALDIPVAAIAAERIADRIWEREWLRDFHAMRFGQRLWVCPTHEHVSQEGAAIVLLDPGLAFGTGTHPTTAMCLRWLDQHLTPDARVIDYGCGSGILGIAAAKLGAHRVHCFDIDPQALMATRDNARANDVDSRLVLCRSPAELPPETDVLLANILSGPLCELAPQLARLVRPAGAIVLAGLLEHQASGVTQAYGAWFDMQPFANHDGWLGLTGKRHDPQALRPLPRRSGPARTLEE